MSIDILKAINNLKSRLLFHSEADFQFALAWELQKLYSDAQIRLEYVEPTHRMHIDIVVFFNGKIYPIELKYRKESITKIINGEHYSLTSQGAQDSGSYDFLKDVSRIEQLLASYNDFEKGYSILVTNDKLYWSKPSSNLKTNFDEFRIFEGAVKTNKLKWAGKAAEGSKGGRTDLDLKGIYSCTWNNFSKIDDAKNGAFRYLIFEISRDS